MIGMAFGGWAAIPAALAFGLFIGLLNGFGVAFLRVPSMICTLGMDTGLDWRLLHAAGPYGVA